MTPDLQEAAFQALYDLAMAALNPGYVVGPDPDHPILPTVPVIRDMQDQDSPCPGVYVSIQASPTMEAQGTMQRGIQDNTGKRSNTQVYVGTCILREANGNGSALTRIRDFSETEVARTIADASTMSILDFGNVTENSINLGNRWISQAFMPVQFTIASATYEILPIIESVEYVGP